MGRMIRFRRINEILEQFKKYCSRSFGAAEADLVRRQLGTYALICPGAANGPSPPPALPNQRPHPFLNALKPREGAGGGEIEVDEISPMM